MPRFSELRPSGLNPRFLEMISRRINFLTIPRTGLLYFFRDLPLFFPTINCRDIDINSTTCFTVSLTIHRQFETYLNGRFPTSLHYCPYERTDDTCYSSPFWMAKRSSCFAAFHIFLRFHILMLLLHSRRYKSQGNFSCICDNVTPRF